jgi:uncharacterized protein (TIGR02611 family)
MQLPDWHSPRELLAFILTSTKRIVVLVVGLALVALGVVLIPLPGPGLLVSVAGLAVLATEFVWAERMLDTVKVKAKRASDVARRSIFRRRDRDTPPT